LILFPTSFGRYHQNKDFGLVGSVSGYVDAGKRTVYCRDAIDLESFYNKSIHPADRMRTHNAYENVIVRDVFDLARRECNSHRVAVCGRKSRGLLVRHAAILFIDLVIGERAVCSFLSCRAESRDLVVSPLGCFAGFLDYASLRSE
jgi:esterase/lipase superfamily enzyme